MSKKQKIWMGVLIVLVTITGTADFFILQGGLQVERASVQEIRGAGFEGVEGKLTSATGENLSARELKVKSSAKDGLFHKNIALSTGCTIENTGAMKSGNFLSVIRSTGGEAASKNIKSLKPNEQFELSGEITPTKAGPLTIACRADPDGVISESDKSDNREVAVIYVFE